MFFDVSSPLGESRSRHSFGTVLTLDMCRLTPGAFYFREPLDRFTSTKTWTVLLPLTPGPFYFREPLDRFTSTFEVAVFRTSIIIKVMAGSRQRCSSVIRSRSAGRPHVAREVSIVSLAYGLSEWLEIGVDDRLHLHTFWYHHLCRTCAGLTLAPAAQKTRRCIFRRIFTKKYAFRGASDSERREMRSTSIRGASAASTLSEL